MFRFNARLFSQVIVGAALLSAGAASAPRAASACGLFDPVSCITGAASGAWHFVSGAASATANWVSDVSGDVAQFAVRDIWGNLATRFTCSSRDIGGIRGACFPSGSMQLNRMRAAMDFLNADTRTTFTKGLVGNPQYYGPASFAKSRVAFFLDGYAHEATFYTVGVDHPNSLAVSTVVSTGSSAPVVIWPAAYSFLVDQIQLASVIVHESDHTRFGAHTCGSGADQLEDGPYGTEIQYLATIARTGNPGYYLSSYDLDRTWVYAASRLGMLCDRNAQKRLWSAFLTKPGSLWTFFSGWQHVADPWVTEIATTVDGSAGNLILGLGGDGMVYGTHAQQPWSRVTPTAGVSLDGTTNPYLQVSKIAVTRDKVIFGLASDGSVYRTNAYATGNWQQVASPWVSALAVTSDQTIYGVGGDGVVYRTTAGQPWTGVTAPWVSQISVTDDGTIYGIGSDQAVYRTTAFQPWQLVAPCCVEQVVATPDRFLYGLASDGNVFMTKAASTGGWTRITESGQVFNFSLTGNLVYGRGGDNAVYLHSSSQN